MIIDFEKIAEAHIEGFKGGEGKLDTRNYVDDRARIMYSTLRPGARAGEHRHEGTFEVIDATEVNGTRYLAVIPYQEDPESLQEDAELILMRIGTDDEGEYMDIVDDDEELITVGKVFEERLRAMYDIDDSELQ